MEKENRELEKIIAEVCGEGRAGGGSGRPMSQVWLLEAESEISLPEPVVYQGRVSGDKRPGSERRRTGKGKGWSWPQVKSGAGLGRWGRLWSTAARWASPAEEPRGWPWAGGGWLRALSVYPPVRGVWAGPQGVHCAPAVARGQRSVRLGGAQAGLTLICA